MRTFKSCHYQVKNGKLVPKEDNLEKSVNYRYIPYTPLNKPMQDDYYKATINSLLTEVQELKEFKNTTKQTGDILNSTFDPQTSNSEMTELIQLRAENQHQKVIIDLRNKQLIESTHENMYLKEAMAELKLELQHLRYKVSRSQMSASRIDQALEKYSEEIIEKINTVERFVDYATVRMSEGFQSQNDNDEFYSIDEKKSYEEEVDERYMTPRVKSVISEEQIQTQKIRDNYLSASVNKFKHTPSTQIQQNQSINSSQCESPYRQGQIKSQRGIYREVDPVAGSLSPWSHFYGK